MGRTAWRGRLGAAAAVAVLLAFPGCRRSFRAPADRSPEWEPPIVFAPAKAGAKFEGSLRRDLLAAPSDRTVTVLVDLTEQVDLDALGRKLARRGSSRSERRREVIRALESVATRQQSRIRPLLDELIRRGELDNAEPVAIVNRFVVEGRPGGILRLADSPEVARILKEWTSGRRRAGRAEDVHLGLGEHFRSWAVDAMGAGTLWAEGLDGRGVLVAAIDTGCRGDHEQLAGRQAPGERGWYDPVYRRRTPYDEHGHGTAILSQAVGGNPDGRVVGIAPGARWAMALGNWHNLYARSRMTLAADWILRVARPDVLVNAWSHDEDPCTRFDLPFVNAWKASGIFVVFPAGNAGPAPRSGEAPAQLAGAFPAGGPVFSVAALRSDGNVLRESSRGPSACGSPAFPTLATPGAGLPYAVPTSANAYLRGDGTSLAAGLLAGAAALLLQADPELTPWELETVLVETARDLPPAGRDDDTGTGLVDLPAALARVRELRARRSTRKTAGSDVSGAPAGETR